MDDLDHYAENGEQYAGQDHFLQVHTPIPELDEEKEGNITRTGTSSSTATGSNTTPETSEAKSRPPLEQPSDIDNLHRHTSTLSRIHTQRSQHSHTVGSIFRSRSSRSRPLPAFGAGKPYPPPLGSQEDYVVEFDGPDDPLHAQNWAVRKKIFTAAMLGFTTMTAAFASSIFSTATREISEKFAVGSVVATLGTSLYVLGFATGPILWAPFSELKGRRLPLVIASFGFSMFEIACATGKDLQTVLICRFFSGFFGACPITVSSIWLPLTIERRH